MGNRALAAAIHGRSSGHPRPLCEHGLGQKEVSDIRSERASDEAGTTTPIRGDDEVEDEEGEEEEEDENCGRRRSDDEG
ncbi:hypothetical protein HZH66_014859 [Vespula vulgaris]|uniref:Uncharacterized protein n=1 Tax=Vespula vulgaris TaxID=7454 RepID=A0A834MQS6_VESVU|nr:hypothetical protein HZH66_014859 [Vespula vulgaris]